MGKKKQLKKIKALAAQLPAQFQEGTIVLSGRQLIASGQKFERSGRAIDPDPNYVVRKPIEVNHYRRLKNLDKKAGSQGMQQYMKSVMNTLPDQFNKHGEVLGSMPNPNSLL